jgi:hypothetical protein|nr:MAG TPA: hypothetical protein [Caudoviricetes sp.]
MTLYYMPGKAALVEAIDNALVDLLRNHPKPAVYNALDWSIKVTTFQGRPSEAVYPFDAIAARLNACLTAHSALTGETTYNRAFKSHIDEIITCECYLSKKGDSKK